MAAGVVSLTWFLQNSDVDEESQLISLRASFTLFDFQTVNAKCLVPAVAAVMPRPPFQEDGLGRSHTKSGDGVCEDEGACAAVAPNRMLRPPTRSSPLQCNSGYDHSQIAQLHECRSFPLPDFRGPGFPPVAQDEACEM